MPDTAPTQTHVERIVLEVDSPKMGLDGNDSGLNVALRKLGAIDRMLKQVESSYARMVRTMGQNPFPGRSGSGSGYFGYGQQRLFDPPQRSASPTPGPAPVSSGGTVNLEVKPEQVNAFVTGGKISLAIHASQIEATVTGKVPATATGSGAGGGGGGGGGGRAGGGGGGTFNPEGQLISRRKIGGETVQEQYRLNPRTVQTVKFKSYPGGSVETTTQEDTNFTKPTSQNKARDEDIKGRVANQKAQQAAAEEAARLTAIERKAEERRIAALRKQQARLLSEANKETAAGTERDYVGHLMGQAQRRNTSLSSVAGGLPNLERIRQEALIKAAEAKSNEMAARTAQSSAARRASSLPSGSERRAATREVMDYGREAVKWQTEFTRQTNTARHASDRFAESTRLIGKNMVENVQHVTAWASSVFILYGSLNLLVNAMGSLTESQYQTARLSQVLRGDFGSQASSAAKLTDEVLRLAGANNRSGKEAMESAIAWARLGLNRVEVTEAVRVSLQAANVAEISAAEATEHLSSLTQVYHLRVSELAGVLGMLNQVSNTYSVTNANLLSGLTRTAAVARQAGIPLAELIGLIGAGVGATGQTGANIGNALKSITGSLSSADTLKTLREKFDFEGTSGTGELKNMSELLSELFVAYNKMSEAEKRSMLFNVAGKNQASRMAAILDNYVKSQTLAISAQLNLNSAELENAKIKDTLRSQLIGLSAEWERFINTQGNRGPIQMLTEVTKGVHNLLRAANAPGINLLMTGMEFLAVGVAAKLALTAYQMAEIGKKGSYVKNSFAGIKNAAGDVAGIMGEVARNGSFLANKFGAKQGGWLGTALRESAMGTPSKSDIGKFVVGDDGKLKRVIQDSATLGISLKEVGRSAKLARLAMAGLTDIVLPMLAVAAVIYAINAGIEAMGLTSDKMNEKVDKLGESAQSAESAANAHQMRARLMRTVQKTFEDPHITEAGRLALAKQTSEGFAPYESSDTNKQKNDKTALRAARLRELEDIAKIKDEEQRLAASRVFWNREASESFALQARKRQEAREDMAQQTAQIDSEIKRLEGSPLSRFHGDRISKLKEKREGLENKRIQSYLEEGQDNEEARDKFRETDVRFKSFVASQKAMLEDLKHLWDQLPGDSYGDKLNKEIAGQEDTLEILKEQLKVKSEAVEKAGLPQGSAGSTEMEATVLSESEAIGNFHAQLKEAKQALQDVNSATGVRRMGYGMDYEGARDRAKERVRELQSQEGDMQRRMEENEKRRATLGKLKTDPDFRLLEEERDSIRKEKEAAEVELNKSRSRQTLAEAADRRQVIMRLGASEASSFGVGDGRGQQFTKEIEGLRKSVAEKEAAADRAGNAQDAENLRIQAMQHRVMLTESLIKGEEMLRELHKEELNLMIQKNREYQRSLLTSGPGELLRRLAVNQLAPRGKAISAGMFFSLEQGARQDILNRPENDESVKTLRRDQAALRGAGFGKKTDREIQDEFVKGQEDRKRLFPGLAPGQIPNIDKLVVLNENAARAATSLGMLASNAALLNVQFDQLNQRVNALFNRANVPMPTTPQNPNA